MLRNDTQSIYTEIIALDAETQKVEELAQMLGSFGASGLQSARELLVEARERKRIGEGKP